MHITTVHRECNNQRGNIVEETTLKDFNYFYNEDATTINPVSKFKKFFINNSKEEEEKSTIH